jgi:type II secretory pathway pseudopilin PulG
MNRNLPPTAGVAALTVIVVMAVIIAVFTGFLALSSPPSSQAQNRDEQRRTNLAAIQQALESYAANHNGLYPATTAVASKFAEFNYRQPQCFGCGLAEYENSAATGVPFTKDDWIPSLVADGYISTLPLDPETGRQDAGLCQSGAWPRGYIYASDGQNYKVTAFCTPSTDLNISDQAESPYCIGPDKLILKPAPDSQPALKPYVDPRAPSFHYSVYTPAWACK